MGSLGARLIRAREREGACEYCEEVLAGKFVGDEFHAHARR